VRVKITKCCEELHSMQPLFDCRTVIFDLDGTLVDTAEDIVAATDSLLALYGLAPIGFEAGRGMIGDGARALVERAFVARAAAMPDPESALARWFEFYRADIARHSRPYPNVRETLATLRRRGIKLGVCTNKATAAAQELLVALDLDSFFDTVVGGDVPHRKPDARHLLLTAERMGVAPESCLMVGDSPNDAAAAKAAKMKLVVVEWGYTPIAPAALGGDALIADFAELEGLLA
jgi:phosphoglycolate phosphatase